MLENVGDPDLGWKEHEAPGGRPLVQERLTDGDVLPSNMTVTVFVPENPGETWIGPEFESANGDWTVNMNCVRCDRTPLIPVTVMVKEPKGVVDRVLMVNVAEKGEEPVQVVEPPQPVSLSLKAGVAPVGSPSTESVTPCAVPLTRVTVIVLKPDTP